MGWLERNWGGEEGTTLIQGLWQNKECINVVTDQTSISCPTTPMRGREEKGWGGPENWKPELFKRISPVWWEERVRDMVALKGGVEEGTKRGVVVVQKGSQAPYQKIASSKNLKEYRKRKEGKKSGQQNTVRRVKTPHRTSNKIRRS